MTRLRPPTWEKSSVPDGILGLAQAATIENPWSWVIAGYTIVYGSMFALTGWLWVRLNRVRRELDQDS